MWLFCKDVFRAGQTGFLPVLPIGVIGSCAADVCEPR
jgi:hypothetical protein